MKIFKRRRFTISVPDSASSLDSRDEERRFSLPYTNNEILYFPDHTPNSINNELANDEISTQTSVSESIALSESDTLLYDKKQQLELQETYNDNFTLYLPFLLRQLRNARDELVDTADHDIDSDDQKTMIDENNISPCLILNKEACNFNLKRRFIIVQELLKHNTYLFASEESFKLFKHLRLNKKKESKNLRIVYDANGSIRRLSASKGSKRGNDIHNDELVDSRTHIIPLEYKVKGLGLPIFKINTPYLSSFRKNSPFLVFKKYREIPLKPTLQDCPSNENSDSLTNYEAYVFCSVYVKHFYDVRRYILNFSPIGKRPFRIIMFQHNFKPFADFNYQNTRFRVVGTSLSCVYVTNYSPIMKLMIIDNDKPSLCDDIINKKTGFEIPSIIKHKKKHPNNNSADNAGNDLNDDMTFSNPYPDPTGPLLADSASFKRLTSKRAFMSRSMPPFGLFKDSVLYGNDSINFIPKKFSDTGKIEIYQDNSNFTEDANSTLSIDLDSLVINCILLTLRESNIRNSVKTTLPQAMTFQD